MASRNNFRSIATTTALLRNYADAVHAARNLPNHSVLASAFMLPASMMRSRVMQRCNARGHSHGSRLFYQFLQDTIWLTCRERGAGEGQMDELIGRLVANVGVDRAAAEKAVGIILQFLQKEGPADKVQALIDRLPGATTLIQNAPEDSSTGGMFGGGVMAAGTRMMAAGLSMGQVQAVTRETINYAREKIGEDAVGEIVGAIPGLGQFV